MRRAESSDRPKRAALLRMSPGFTLVELLFVLVIISVLAGLVVPRLASRSTHAREVAARWSPEFGQPAKVDSSLLRRRIHGQAPEVFS